MSEQPCTAKGYCLPRQDESKPLTAAPPNCESSSSNRSAPAPSDGGNSSFDCNICLDLAQDPVVTLCGHLFCWPCLYRWLRRHSTCQECPVCKAVVEEDKVVPLYGRGNTNPSDPRQKKQNLSDPDGIGSVPHRPAGPRPETARPPPPDDSFHGPLPGFAFSGAGPVPMATARFGNFTFSAGFGLFPSLFGIQLHGIPDYSGFGHSYPSFVSTGFHGTPAYNPVPDQQEAKLSRLLMCLGFLVLFYILFF